MSDLTAVVMAGGLGTRMKSATPKHLHPLLGRRMVDWVVRAAQDAGVQRVIVVASPDSASSFDGLEVAVQEVALGTGDAVRAARSALVPHRPIRRAARAHPHAARRQSRTRWSH